VVFQFSPEMTNGESEAASVLSPELSSKLVTEPSDAFFYKQLSNAEWTDLIRGLGCTGIRQAVAIYPKQEN